MISIIVAVSKNNVIGDHGVIPWRIKGEQTRFRELTINHTIIMGRKSFEEIGHPLPKRRTIVISKIKKTSCPNCKTVKSLKEALELTEKEDEVFIAGGGQIYMLALPYADRIYLTIIDKIVEGNVFFPEVNLQEFKKVYEERVQAEISYTYYTYDRMKNSK
ncbi:dihydrofolate reductase [Sporolactobacillus sp. STCC-11]|uniref:dihydrofolate reductase n=1 Tax=Sporolactobacillus caesalpiniae TaxID=3230362 RepID=UPI003392F2DE